jgi:hypothetical protein
LSAAAVENRRASSFWAIALARLSPTTSSVLTSASSMASTSMAVTRPSFFGVSLTESPSTLSVGNSSPGSSQAAASASTVSFGIVSEPPSTGKNDAPLESSTDSCASFVRSTELQSCVAHGNGAG